jgi:Cft2 family RNA processing exonuclease
LGAAQLLIEYEGERTVCTGDVELAGADLRVGDRDRLVRAGLIVESTFALPIYDFLTAAEAQRRIVQFAGRGDGGGAGAGLFWATAWGGARRSCTP